MQNLNAIKIAKFIIIFASALACASAAQDQPRRQLEFAGVDAPYETRAGADDGAAFAIHFTGSTHGSLEPCG